MSMLSSFRLRGSALLTSRACTRRLESVASTAAVSVAATGPSLYMWGTNSKGTIPGAERPLIDVPTEIDWKKLLKGPLQSVTLVNDSTLNKAGVTDSRRCIVVLLLVEDDDAATIQQIACGSTDTALVLSDGRCFVSGANKQGQLG